jgi:hypothetical protein
MILASSAQKAEERRPSRVVRADGLTTADEVPV